MHSGIAEDRTARQGILHNRVFERDFCNTRLDSRSQPPNGSWCSRKSCALPWHGMATTHEQMVEKDHRSYLARSAGPLPIRRVNRRCRRVIDLVQDPRNLSQSPSFEPICPPNNPGYRGKFSLYTDGEYDPCLVVCPAHLSAQCTSDSADETTASPTQVLPLRSLYISHSGNLSISPQCRCNRTPPQTWEAPNRDVRKPLYQRLPDLAGHGRLGACSWTRRSDQLVTHHLVYLASCIGYI